MRNSTCQNKTLRSDNPEAVYTTPEGALLCCILIRALKDTLNPDRTIRNEAFTWLSDCEPHQKDGHISLDLVCQLLGAPTAKVSAACLQPHRLLALLDQLEKSMRVNNVRPPKVNP